MEIACENIDQLVTISIRPPGMPRGVSQALYRAARQSRPISLEIAEALLAVRGARVGVFTGASVPDHLPHGENDGPLGAVVLARALSRLGFPATVYVEAEPLRATRELVRAARADVGVEELQRDPGEQQERLPRELDVAITVEKAGVNEYGIQHSVNGHSRQGTRAILDPLINRMNEVGKLTVGIGDGGNEIGFGAIFEQARSIVPYGTRCQCPCGRGIVSITSTKFLYPVAVSNWGAYGLAAALGVMAQDPDCAHAPQLEETMIRAGMEMDLRDGGTGKPVFAVDGVPGEASVGLVSLLDAIVRVTLIPFSRKF